MFQKHLAALLILGAPLVSLAALQQPVQQPVQDTTGGAVDSTWTPAPLTVEQIDTLVAPIALYPDKLVAQVLAAATWPDQVVIAKQWLDNNKALTDSVLAAAVNRQGWDPAVKALAQFPDVLNQLASNLAWTSSLGQAYHFQKADVMAAVQAMRQRALASGQLKTTPQQTVTQAGNTIVIQPTDTQYVYVPQYNTTVVYGTPYPVPYYVSPWPPGPAIVFGPRVWIGPWWYYQPWGWGGWGMRWGMGGGVWYGGIGYVSNPYWHGGGYWGYRPWGPRPGPGPWGPHPYPGRPVGPAPGYRPPPGGGVRPMPMPTPSPGGGFRPTPGGDFSGGGGFRPGGDRPGGYAPGQSRMPMSGGGGWSRAEGNRGFGSMDGGMRAPEGGGMRGGGFGGGGMRGGFGGARR